MTERDGVRFEAKIERIPFLTCWVWMGVMTHNGYGQFWLDGQARKAHRVAYEFYREKILRDLTLDHLCRNRWCVNPSHLEAVTMRDNVLRGDGPTAKNARKTVCINGHPFDQFNTHIRTGSRAGRDCRVCKAIGTRASYLRCQARKSSP